MQKIISLFQRNYDTDRLVRNEVVSGAEWVIAGEGMATQKLDGTCCMIDALGRFFKRYDAKHGKTPPLGFIPAQEADPVTGHWPGWIMVGSGPEDKYHREALDQLEIYKDGPGTYELCGPKINGNPEHQAKHVLLAHGSITLPNAPRDFEGLKAFMSSYTPEGIVWHHPDGRMVKLKRKDFFR